MKQGFPWSVEGVRTQTLGQWLNTVIAEKSEPDPSKKQLSHGSAARASDDIGEVIERAVAETRSGARVESSTLSALDSVARWMETVDSRRREDTRHLATLQEKTSEGLRGAMDRVVKQVDSLERRVEEVKTAPIAPISEKLDRIVTRLDGQNDDPKLAQRIEVTLKELDGRFAALAAKLESAPSSGPMGAARPPAPARPVQARAYGAPLPAGPPLPAQERLARAVAEIRARQADLSDLDAPRFDPPPAEPLSDVADRLMDEVASLGRKLDTVMAAPTPERGPRLDDIVKALREHLPAPPSLDAFDQRLERIGAQIESLSKQTAGGESLDRLGRELAEIRGMVDLGGLRQDIAAIGGTGGAASNEALGALQRTLGELKDAIRAPAWDAASSRIAALEAAVADLPRQIARMVPNPAPADLRPLEERLQDLVRRIESQAKGEPADLVEVSRKIDDLTGRLGHADESFRGIARLERSVADLLIRIDQERREAGSGTGSDSAETGRRIEETLSDLRETLALLADRLASAPDIQRQAPPPAFAKDALPPEAPAPPKSLAEKLAAATSAAEAARAAMPAAAKHGSSPAARLDALKSGSKAPDPDPSEALQAAAPAERRPAPQDPRETSPDPAASAAAPVGASQLVAAARAAAARTAGAAASNAAQEGAGKVESSIQALRGKAQAAQAEANANANASDKGNSSSRLAGLRAFAANKRRPLIIGAAALAAALGAGPILFKQFSAGDGVPEAAGIVVPADQHSGGTTPPHPATEPPAGTPSEPGKSSDAGKASGASQLFSPTGLANASGFMSRQSGGLSEPVVVGSLGAAPRAVAGQPMPLAQGFDEPIPPGLPAMLSRALEAGDAVAAYELALRYFEGRSMPKDARQAALWMERAANRSYAPAQYRLGSLYEKGQGVAKDRSQARAWYEKAAAAGNVKAMHNLGVLLAEGEAGKPDFAAAAHWFRQGAEAGLKDSQYNLAILAGRGLGMQQNLPESFMWFSLAAAQGDEDAARKREEVAAKLDPTTLASSKSATLAFRAKPADQAANEPAGPAAGQNKSAPDPRKDASRQKPSGT